MQKINYPLLVTDFDGTLLRKDGMIADETYEAIAEYKKAGGNVAICTGRMFSSILPIVRKMGLTGLVSCFQGAIVADIESGALVVDGSLPNSEAVEICRQLEEQGHHIHVYDTNVFYCNVVDDLLAYYENIVKVKGVIVDKEPLYKFIEKENISVRKILVMIHPEQREKVYNEFVERYGEKYYVTCGAPILVELSNPAYTKATALEKIAEYYGVPVEKTIAVGDSLNDLPMIERAGLGIAVGNAETALKERADVVFSATNNEDAIGKIIRQYGFEQN